MTPTRARLNVEWLDSRLVPAVVDLTSAGAGATLTNGAIVHRNDTSWNNANGPQAHGRGVMDSFLRIDANGVEEGYNTTARPFQLDQVKNGTSALTLSQVPVVTVNGTAYREFVLDINEPRQSRDLSLDEVRVYVADQGNLKNYNSGNGKLGGQSPIYNLDSTGDVIVMLRSMTNQGPRTSEMALLVPNSLFAGKPNSSFVYLYSKLGATAGAGAAGDAEEWGVRRSPPASPPPPPANGSISGQVFADSNQDGTFNTDSVQVGNTLYLPDTPLEGVSVQLLSNGSVIATTTTDVDGNYKFLNVAPGTYSIKEASQPAGYSDGKDYSGGVTVGTAGTTDQIDGVTVVSNTDSGGNLFTENGGNISGLVFFDANQDQYADQDEHPIQGATVHLLVLTDPNNPLEFIITTGADGIFNFAGLAAGTYTLMEDTTVWDPSGQNYGDGADFQGTMGDSNTNTAPNTVNSSGFNEFDNIALTAGQQAQNYTFTHVLASE